MDTCICMAESLLYSPEIVTILLFGDIPIKNKKLKKKKQNRATKKKKFYHKDPIIKFCHI